MKKRVTPKSWIPFWGDKWLFGSMRLEFSAAERGIWWDLMALAMKDDGFIRANEEFAYHVDQLAGLFRVPAKELQEAIHKFVKAKKITRYNNGILYITNWEKYAFTDRHMRRVEKEDEEMSDKTDIMSQKADSEGDIADTRLDKIRKDKNRKENTYIKEFNQFWNTYNVKTAKQDAFNAFKALRRKKVEFEKIMEAVKGYKNHLKNEKIHNNFDKKPKFPAGFLRNEYWKDFIGVEYRPPM